MALQSSNVMNLASHVLAGALTSGEEREAPAGSCRIFDADLSRRGGGGTLIRMLKRSPGWSHCLVVIPLGTEVVNKPSSKDSLNSGESPRSCC
jgi:hypothetical protein